MKMFYNGTPVESMKIKHYEMNTNDATLRESDLQSGITAYARGKKVTGTGKAFEFASYVNSYSNTMIPLPNIINVFQISSTEYPVQQLMDFDNIRNADFNISQTIGNIVKDGIVYPINVQIINNILKLSCDTSVKIQLFYGKDNYI